MYLSPLVPAFCWAQPFVSVLHILQSSHLELASWHVLGSISSERECIMFDSSKAPMPLYGHVLEVYLEMECCCTSSEMDRCNGAL